MKIEKSQISSSPVATGSHISQRVNSPNVSLTLPVLPSGAPGRERYEEWRELIHELHEALSQIGYAFLPINVITPGIEINDPEKGMRRGYRVIRDRLFIADTLAREKVLERYEELVKYAISRDAPREPSQRGCPTMNGFDMKASAFEDALMEIARKDIGQNPSSGSQTGRVQTEQPHPNLEFAGSKQKPVFISPFASEGFCDPRDEDERMKSVQSLILRFENRILRDRKIGRALNVIAKIRFQSKDRVTERTVDYGVWLNSACQSTDVGIGDTVELVLMCLVDNTPMTFSDRRCENHSFHSEFSYIEEGNVADLDIVDVTLIDKNTQASLNCKFRIWIEGTSLCVAQL